MEEVANGLKVIQSRWNFLPQCSILLYLLSSVTLTGILLYLLSSVSVSNLHLKKDQILSKRFIFSRRYGVGEGGSEQRGPCIII